MNWKYLLYRLGFRSSYVDAPTGIQFARSKWIDMTVIGATIFIPGIVSNHYLSEHELRVPYHILMAVVVYILSAILFFKGRSVKKDVERQQGQAFSKKNKS